MDRSWWPAGPRGLARGSRISWGACASDLGARKTELVARVRTPHGCLTAWVATPRPGPESRERRAPTQRVRESAWARHRDRHRQRESGGARERWGRTQRVRGSAGTPHTQRRAPTQREPRPNTESERVPEPDTESTGARHRKRRESAGARSRLKQKLHRNSPVSLPMHAQRSADLSTVQLSRGRVFLWRTIP